MQNTPFWQHTMLGGLTQLRRYRQYQFSSFDTRGGNRDYVSLAPGETRILCEVDGPGCLRRVWFTLNSADPYLLRTTVLRMTWDGHAAPSVEVPIGDFFGAGFAREPHFAALPFGVSSGGFYSYWPMPFAEGARVEVVNQSAWPLRALYYHVNVDRFSSPPPKNTGRFHARWTRQTTRKDEDFTLLDTEGEGHYVGCFLTMQGPYPFCFWFLEGDERITVDGEPFPPTIHGTGTEDYFNGAWYFSRGPFAAPAHGVTVKDPLKARIAAYRCHLEDPIPFTRSLQVNFEHGGVNDMPGSDYTGTAWWYAARATAAGPPLPATEDRLPKDPPLEKLLKTRALPPVIDLGFKAYNQLRELFYPKL